jgi:hypothetical protein
LPWLPAPFAIATPTATFASVPIKLLCDAPFLSSGGTTPPNRAARPRQNRGLAIPGCRPPRALCDLQAACCAGLSGTLSQSMVSGRSLE